MIAWAPIVFVRLLFFLVTGILVHIFSGKSWDQAAYWFAVAALAYMLLAVFLGRKGNSRWRNFLGILAFGCTFLFGIALVQVRTAKFQKNHLEGYGNNYTFYRGKIDAYLVAKPASYKTEVAVTHVLANGIWQPVSGNVLVTLPKNKNTAQLKYGHILVIKGMPAALAAPLNPGEFNYRRYLHRRNVYHQQFLQPGSFAVAGYDPQNPLLSLAFSIRQTLDDVLRRYLPGNQEYGLAKALVLGIKDELGSDILRAYTNTGTMHVLAVSGLHVGLIYGMLELVFRSKKRSRKSQAFFSVITLCVIWLYALITGFSASVLRAVVMFTFLSIGRLLNRTNATYNVLALSAFCLLVYNPYLILDVGFQLSYMAVLGIVYVHPKLERLLEFESTPLNWLWTITSISIAAQLATFPLSLYYFHQFPVYFIFSNLFIIPVSTVVMWGGIGLVLVGWLSEVAHWLGLALNWLIWFMNQGIFVFEQLPNSILSGFHIYWFECGLIYLFIVLLLVFFSERRLWYFAFAALPLVLLSGLQIYEKLKLQQEGRFTVYAIRKHSAIEISGKNSGMFLADSAVMGNPAMLQYSVVTNWAELDAEAPQLVWLNQPRPSANLSILPDGNRIGARLGYTFLLISKPLQTSFAPGVRVNFVVLQNNVRQPLSALGNLSFDHLILDTSNNAWYGKRKQAEAAEAGVELYQVSTKGAFVHTLDLP